MTVGHTPCVHVIVALDKHAIILAANKIDAIMIMQAVSILHQIIHCPFLWHMVFLHCRTLRGSCLCSCSLPW